MQIIETAGAACRAQIFQCPARWMSSTTEECYLDSGPTAGSEGETSCTSFLEKNCSQQ